MQVVVASPRQHRPRLRVVLFALVAAAGLAVIGARPAHAAEPCWQAVVSDWSDGRIDGTYPVHCYREALRQMPEDVRLYSSAEDDIRHALAASIGTPGEPPTAAGPSSSGTNGLTVLLVVGGGVLALMGALALAGFALRRGTRRRPETSESMRR
jgi:hypothetical protein